MATVEEVRRQLGGISSDVVSNDIILQAISQATNEIEARKRTDAPAVLVEDAKVKLSAFYAWSAVIKSGRYELDTIREEGYDIMMNNYKDLADKAVELVCKQATTISTDLEEE